MKQILLVLVLIGAGVALFILFKPSGEQPKGKELSPDDIKAQKERAGSQTSEEDKAKDRVGGQKQENGQTPGDPGSGWPTDPDQIPTDPDEIRGDQQK